MSIRMSLPGKPACSHMAPCDTLTGAHIGLASLGESDPHIRDLPLWQPYWKRQSTGGETDVAETNFQYLLVTICQ